MIKMTETILESKNNKLEFTGNWFIDAGILGFVNLMEEVYGWDLGELQKRIDENEELVYYGYFPFAYLFYYSKIRKHDSEIKEIKSNIKKEKEKHTKKKNELSTLLMEKTFGENNTKKSKLKKIEEKT